MTTRLRELRTRSIADAAVALRDATDAAPVFVGKPIVYNSRTAIGNPLRWGFYEEVAPGAATKTLQEGDIRFLVDHDTSMPVSRSSAGTLRLMETDGGVDVDSDLNTAKSYVADLVENLRDKTITGMSFGFIVTKDEWSTVDVATADGQTVEADLRVIREFRLLEVSAVTFPAYEDTEAGLRKMTAAVRAMRDGSLSASDIEAFELAGRAAGERQPAEATGAPETQPAAATVPAQLLLARHAAFAALLGK
jgi:uncharacterized protein